MDWERLAAAYALNDLSSAEILHVAEALIEAGEWSYAIDEIYLTRPTIRSDVDEPFETILRNRGISIPEREDAIRTMMRAHLRDIDEGVVGSGEGMWLVVELERDSKLANTKYIGDAHGLSELIGAYYSLDHLQEMFGYLDTAEIREMEERIRTLAREWLQADPSRAQ